MQFLQIGFLYHFRWRSLFLGLSTLLSNFKQVIPCLLHLKSICSRIWLELEFVSLQSYSGLVLLQTLVLLFGSWWFECIYLWPMKGHAMVCHYEIVLDSSKLHLTGSNSTSISWYPKSICIAHRSLLETLSFVDFRRTFSQLMGHPVLISQV